MKIVEVEVRSFITDEEYQRLKKFFDSSAVFVKDDFEESIYFDGDVDIRLLKGRNASKIWFKSGKMHDEIREEIEIPFDNAHYEQCQELFARLGYKQEIKWHRQRLEYKWGDVSVMMDSTKGYGLKLELEINCSMDEKEKTLNFLNEKLAELGIKQTSPDTFKEKFDYYKQHWHQLLQEAA